MNVLLSIKPEFAFKIFNGKKKYEYRRAIFKRSDIDKVIVYASAPVSKIIGEFEVEKIICDDIKNLWFNTKNDSGISEKFFYNYFSDKEKGYAIKIKNSIQYDHPHCLRTEYGLTPPQSFIYIDKRESRKE